MNPSLRRAIEDRIETLIALLDAADGDADNETEQDLGADDLGEPEGVALMDLAA